MKREALLGVAATWSGDTWAERIDQCASMLFCHGYIPLSQREKIARKLQAEFDAACRGSGRHAQRENGRSPVEAEGCQSGPEGIAQKVPS